MSDTVWVDLTEDWVAVRNSQPRFAIQCLSSPIDWTIQDGSEVPGKDTAFLRQAAGVPFSVSALSSGDDIYLRVPNGTARAAIARGGATVDVEG